jgi:sodium-dependent dicarboxylate transporter 2/3/5
VRTEQKPWTTGEIVTACVFALAVVGWIVPGVYSALELPRADVLEDLLSAENVALGVCVLLFLPDEHGKRVMPWKTAVRIDWGIILLFGGGLSLGKQMFDTGLAGEIAGTFVAASGVTDLWTLTALVTVFTIFFTEVCSNTAAANMLAPLVIAMARELEVSPLPPVLAVGIAATCGFMLPVGTGPNALVYGTRKVDQWTMIKVGFFVDVVSAIVIVIALRILCPLFGWD